MNNRKLLFMHLESESPSSSHEQIPYQMGPASLGIDRVVLLTVWYGGRSEGNLWVSLERHWSYSWVLCHMTYWSPRRSHSSVLGNQDSGMEIWGRHTIQAISILMIRLGGVILSSDCELDFKCPHLCWRLDLLSAVSTGGTLRHKNCDVMDGLNSKSTGSWTLVGECDKWGPVLKGFILSVCPFPSCSSSPTPYPSPLLLNHHEVNVFALPSAAPHALPLHGPRWHRQVTTHRNLRICEPRYLSSLCWFSRVFLS